MEIEIMRKHLVILILCASSLAWSQTIRLGNFEQISHPIENKNYEYGNVYFPDWSKSDDLLGVTFFDPNKSSDFVFVYDVVHKNGWKYDASITGEVKQASEFDAPASTSIKRTAMLQWSPLVDNRFFVISRDNKKDYLYRVDFQYQHPKFQMERINKISDQELPIQYFSISNVLVDNFWGSQKYFISVCSGAKGRTKSSVYQANKTSISKEIFGTKNLHIIEAEVSCYINGNFKEFVAQGIQNDQSDIYYYEVDRFQTPVTMKNITNTKEYDERNPLQNFTNNLISFVRANRQISKKGIENKLKYSLYIYDKSTGKETLVDENVYIVPDVPNVKSYIWLPNDQILYIKDDYEDKYPLKLYTVSDGHIYDVSSPLVNHKELALSRDHKRLAIVAKGKRDESLELSFNKLYICDIEY